VKILDIKRMVGLSITITLLSVFAQISYGQIRPTKLERVPLFPATGDPIWEFTVQVALDISGWEMLDFPTGLDVKNIINTDFSLTVVADAGWCQLITVKTEWIHPEERMVHSIKCNGRWGKGNEGYRYPFGVVIGNYDGIFNPAVDFIFVTDTGNKRIKRLRYDVGQNNLLWDYNFGDNYLLHPQGLVYCDKGTETRNDDEIFVADSDLAKIVRFAVNGDYLGSYGVTGYDQGEFRAPIGICKGPNGTAWENYFYITDPYNFKICCYEFEDNSLSIVNEIAFPEGDPRKSEFMGIATDHAGWVYAADWSKNRLVKLSPLLSLNAIIDASSGPDFAFNAPIGLCFYDSALAVINEYTMNSGIMAFGVPFTTDSLIWDEEWTGDVNIHLYADFRVPCGRELSLARGTHVLIEPDVDYHNIGDEPDLIEILIEGFLNSYGNEPDSVKFYSAGTPPQPGDWYGIRILEPCGSVNMHFTSVTDAQNALDFYDGTDNSNYIYGYLFDSHFAHNSVAGVYSVNSVLNIERCLIKDNPVYGLYSFKTAANVYDSRFLNNVSYGIYVNLSGSYADSVRIVRDVIDCASGGTSSLNGLFISHDRARVEGCKISNYNSAALLVSGGSPLLRLDTLTNKIGMDCQKNSSPKIRYCRITASRLDIGVSADKGSFPDLGTGINYEGNNSIYPTVTSGGFRIVNKNVSTVYAKYNWWGTSTPTPSMFSGSVAYSPWLYGEPPPPPKMSFNSEMLPDRFIISNNYPNPFNTTTRISYGVPIAGQITITIYNVLGQVVKVLEDRAVGAGFYQLQWDGTNRFGEAVGSGIYLINFRFGDSQETRKAILLR